MPLLCFLLLLRNKPLFVFQFLPAAGPSHSSLKGVLKSVSWLFFITQNVFSFMPCVCVGRNGIILPFCGALLSVCFRLAWTAALGSRWAEQWGAGARRPGWPSPALFIIYSTKPCFSREILFRPPRKYWERLHEHWPTTGFHSQPSPVRPWGCFCVLPLSGVRSLVLEWEGNCSVCLEIY